jgi:cytochrome oxidase Cu insertion factor (SCO1/SenC/PrrC family)
MAIGRWIGTAPTGIAPTGNCQPRERHATLAHMKTFRIAFACATLAASLVAQNVTPPKTTLKVDDEAPDFTLPDTDNKPVKLSDFRGKKMVVLAFFPAAFTGG